MTDWSEDYDELFDGPRKEEEEDVAVIEGEKEEVDDESSDEEDAGPTPKFVSQFGPSEIIPEKPKAERKAKYDELRKKRAIVYQASDAQYAMLLASRTGGPRLSCSVAVSEGGSSDITIERFATPETYKEEAKEKEGLRTFAAPGVDDVEPEHDIDDADESTDSIQSASGADDSSDRIQSASGADNSSDRIHSASGAAESFEEEEEEVPVLFFVHSCIVS